MASMFWKREVLGAFRKLHRTRRKVFNEDDRALTAARVKINEEFRKNKDVTDEAAIKELVDLANAVEHEIRTTIIQAKEVAPGRFEARITEETSLLVNKEFDITKCPDHPKSSKSKSSRCSQQPSPKPQSI